MFKLLKVDNPLRTNEIQVANLQGH